MFSCLKNLFIILVLLSLCSCKREDRKVDFYYWQTQFNLDKTERSTLAKTHSTVVYTRFFDVDKENGNIHPEGIIKIDSTLSIQQKITPVVFITNRTWVNISMEELDFLAKKVNTEINKIAKKTSLELTHEIQIDSDWTASTKTDYFTFLEKLKLASNKEVTSTIRLHQIKDKNLMGIPPVKKGILMCYATSSPLKNQKENSILDIELMKNYLQSLEDYSLNLDFALPLYSWGIVSNHLNKKRLINGLSHQKLKNTKGIQFVKDNHYLIQEDGFYFGHYLSKGFTIKVEEVSNETLKESLEFLDKKMGHKIPLIYYHLDTQFLENRNVQL